MSVLSRCHRLNFINLKGYSDEKTRFFKKSQILEKTPPNVVYAFHIMNLTYFHQHFNVITSKYLFFIASTILGMSPAYLFEEAWSEDLWRHLLNISLAATWVNNGKYVWKRSFVFDWSWFLDFGAIAWLWKTFWVTYLWLWRFRLVATEAKAATYRRERAEKEKQEECLEIV